MFNAISCQSRTAPLLSREPLCTPLPLHGRRLGRGATHTGSAASPRFRSTRFEAGQQAAALRLGGTSETVAILSLGEVASLVSPSPEFAPLALSHRSLLLLQPRAAGRQGERTAVARRRLQASGRHLAIVFRFGSKEAR